MTLSTRWLPIFFMPPFSAGQNSALAVLGLCVAGLLAASPTVQAAAPVTVLSRADYEACQKRDESAFRQAIETVTQGALQRSLSAFNYKGAVDDAWRGNGIDDVVDKQVDKAVAEIGSERSWGEILQSLTDSAKAQELAGTVAERVYASPAIKTAIETVATDVGRTLGLSLEFATQDAAEPAIQCLKAFLGPRYGATVAAAVTADAEREFGIDASKGKAAISPGAVLADKSGGVTGAALLLLRRQMANLAGRVGARIAGSVLSRLVSVAAGGVGAVLIAKDIWDLRAGVLPIIATEMKSVATKDLIRAELAKSISEQIGEQIKDLSSKSAARIVEIWQEFRSAHAKSLEIADKVPAFRDFLDRTPAKNLPRLDEAVGLILATGGGEAQVIAALADGRLDTIVNKLSPDAMTIARETRSLDRGIAWSAIAGDRLVPFVVEHELHKRADPSSFTQASLTRLLSLEDKLAIARLAAQKREARDTLFDLDLARLRVLARALPEGEIASLAGYLASLEKATRDRVLQAVAATPAKMRVLAADRVRAGILASRDQGKALDMMLRDGMGTPAEVAADFRAAYDGAIDPFLLWDRHPVLIAGMIVPLAVVLLLLRRILFTRPRRSPPAATAS